MHMYGTDSFFFVFLSISIAASVVSFSVSLYTSLSPVFKFCPLLASGGMTGGTWTEKNVQLDLQGVHYRSPTVNVFAKSGQDNKLSQLCIFKNICY